MRLKIASWKGKFNVEEKATLRGELAYTTWSIEEHAVQGSEFPYGEEENIVVNFRAHSLRLLGKV